MNLSQMQRAIYEAYIRELDGMSLEECKAELSHFYERELYDMDGQEIQATYEYIQGEL
jgi:hypothetical protein